jgi:hypothetical protein
MLAPRRLLAATCAATFVLLGGAARPALADADHSAGSGLPAAAVLDWNSIAVSTVRSAAPAKFQVEGIIYMSYVQGAVYDAVTKIEGRYAPYHDFAAPVDPAGASPDAAVAAAAYTTLANYFPAQAAALTTTYDAYVAALPLAGKADGVAIGVAAANDMIAFRTGDGRGAVITTPYGQGPLTPGGWVFAPPPSAQSAQTPWVAFMRPFMLESATQFRAGPPPSLSSNEWVKEFDEVQAYGSATSAVRSDEQTRVAQFWNANAINQSNQTLHDIATQHGFDLVDAARAFAMGNLTDSDAGIACFDSKYHYLFWRPVTAIRNADIDGNAGTVADPTWTPLLVTPNHPEYPAAHGCLTAAEAEVYAELLGTHHIDVDIQGALGSTSTALAVTRHYSTVEELQKEIVNARIWAGLHYRGSADAGVALGRDVARWSLKRFFLPLHGGDDGSDD